jgi:CIC family chloride channel protein
MLARALAAGALAGLVAVAFRFTLEYADRLRNVLIALDHGVPAFGWAGPVFACAAAAGLGVWLTRRFAPEAAGSGIPHVEAAVRGEVEPPGLRTLVVKFLGGTLCIGSGMALGREGPTVQMGGAVGHLVHRFCGGDQRQLRVLIAAGAGAGLAATFNAPLAGMLFVLEELYRRFAPPLLTAAFVACLAADIVTRVALGPEPAFRVAFVPPGPLANLAGYAALGILAGLLGAVFNKGVLTALDLFDSLPERARVPAAAVVGGWAGLLAWYTPGLVGGGEPLAQATLSGLLRPDLLPVLFALRLLLTLASYGCGAPGGIFAPLLVLGAMIGLWTGAVGQLMFPGWVTEPAKFAAVGMAAYFTAVVRAPVTGIVLILEMTNGQELLLPLLLASYAAYRVAEVLHDEPIYEALGARARRVVALQPDPRP